MDHIEDTLKDAKAILVRVLQHKQGLQELHGDTYINYVIAKIDEHLENVNKEEVWDVLA